MKKPTEFIEGAGAKHTCPDVRFCEEYPRTVEFLSALTYDDGSPRERSTLSLFLEDGVLKAALNDKDNHRTLYASADTFDGVLRALEAALDGGSPAWRSWRQQKRK